jgi:biotin-(acetyl-CoA carboxylase) ligase
LGVVTYLIGIGIGIGIELTAPVFAKLLADRVVTLSELRQHAQRNRLRCAQALILRVAVRPVDADLQV